MRVIAGRLGGRQFNSPRGHQTHPMSDKMRGALFNVLGDLSGLSVLDAFGGSGAISFEAASRNAQNVLVIETDRSAQKVIESNIKSLGLDNQIKLVRANTSSWLKNNLGSRFNIIVLDPSYEDLQPALLGDLSRQLKEGGILILSWPGKQEAPVFGNLKAETKKNYGDSQLVFYKQVA